MQSNTSRSYHEVMDRAAQLASTGDTVEAVASYSEAIAADPQRPEAHRELALLYHCQGRFAEAIAQFQKVVELHPQDATTWNNLGVVYFSQSEWVRAEDAFRQALAQNARYAGAWYGLAKVLLQHGRDEEAAEALHTCLRWEPRHEKAQKALRALGVEVSMGATDAQGLTDFIHSHPPLIVVGMHRSGTTLLARLLERCGVFMGVRQSMNGEAILFQSLNRDALDPLGCSWRCLDYLPPTEKLHSQYQWLPAMMAQRLNQQMVAGFWGPVAAQISTNPPPAWGWKDPRNSLLLPAWQRVFPNATVLHIYRDGRDAALSLLTREIKRENGSSPFDEYEMMRRFCIDVRLWEGYVRRIQEALPLFKSHYSVQYERLLSDPEEEMKKIVRALSIPVRDSLRDVVSVIDPSRAHRHRQNGFSWARGLADDSPLLKELGYT